VVFLSGLGWTSHWARPVRPGAIGQAFGARWQLGLRAALSVGIPLMAGVIAGRPSWGAVASFGGFAGF
jgi:hypothetical protein